MGCVIELSLGPITMCDSISSGTDEQFRPEDNCSLSVPIHARLDCCSHLITMKSCTLTRYKTANENSNQGTHELTQNSAN